MSGSSSFMVGLGRAYESACGRVPSRCPRQGVEQQIKWLEDSMYL